MWARVTPCVLWQTMVNRNSSLSQAACNLTCSKGKATNDITTRWSRLPKGTIQMSQPSSTLKHMHLGNLQSCSTRLSNIIYCALTCLMTGSKLACSGFTGRFNSGLVRTQYHPFEEEAPSLDTKQAMQATTYTCNFALPLSPLPLSLSLSIFLSVSVCVCVSLSRSPSLSFSLSV